MFSFIKKKPILQDLIPDGHIDIHSHLLPGIDDGSKSIEDTTALLDGLKKVGFAKFITTPHIMRSVWDNTKTGIEEKLEETNGLLNSAGNGIPMKAAAEYLIDGNFVDLFKSQQLLTLKDNHVLIEMSYINPPIQLFDILFELQVAGYVPILAHPERYAFYHGGLNEFKKLKNAGCLFQINLLSTVGYYGQGVFKTAERLLKFGMIDYVGSDVHHEKHVASFGKRIYLEDVKPLQEAIARNKVFDF